MPRHVIRVGVEGWDVHHSAQTVEDVNGGLGPRWVEIDGHRLPGSVLSEARIVASGGTFLVCSVDLIGRVELVYVDGDGNPLPEVRGRIE